MRYLPLLALLVLSIPLQAEMKTVYIGTYTGGDSKGIYALEFNDETGELRKLGLAAETPNPSFVALSADGKFLYAVNETDTGELSSFTIKEGSHELQFINQKPSGGGAPCHLVIDTTGKNLLVANYTGGSVSATQIMQDGSLGKQTAFIQHTGSSITDRQKSPHGHSINCSADNRFAIAADLGKDELITYAFDAKAGSLKASSTAKLKPGAGPRHFAFNPAHPYAYSINELNSTVSVFEYDAKSGKLEIGQSISTLPTGFDGNNSTAEVVVSPDGKFVYGSNRGHNSIAVFAVGEDYRLTQVEVEPLGGKTPRNFVLDPSGRFLLGAAQGSDLINVFARDPKTGKLAKTNHSIEVPNPVCIRFAR